MAETVKSALNLPSLSSVHMQVIIIISYEKYLFSYLIYGLSNVNLQRTLS